MPIDMAGFIGHKNVIKVFIEHAAAGIEKQFKLGDGIIRLNEPVRKPVFDKLSFLKKLPKS